jgi:heme A synthase
LATRYHPWLCYLALATLLAVLVQIGVGSVVTGIQAGMSDPDWPTPPWQVFFPTRKDAAYLIEQSHRTTGGLVGVCAIGLAVGLWVGEPRPRLRWAGLAAVALMVGTLAAGFAVVGHRGEGLAPPVAEDDWSVTPADDAAPGPAPALGPPLWFACLGLCLACAGGFLVPAARLRDWDCWRRWLGMLALAGVIVQGLLGGFRVFWNAKAGPDLALFHACLAQAILVLVVVLVVLTSPGWSREGAAVRRAGAGWLGRWSPALAGLVALQVVLGVLLSHSLLPRVASVLSPAFVPAVVARLHFLTALAVAVSVGLVAQRTWLGGRGGEPRRLVWFLAAAVAVQLLLGVEAWMVKFGTGSLPSLVQVTPGQAAVRTLHVLTGSCLLAAVTVLVLQTRVRAPALTAAPAPVPAAQLEGVT